MLRTTLTTQSSLVTITGTNWFSPLLIIYVGLSFSEEDAAHLYMAQPLIAPDGEILIHRHKLRPSAQKRDLWTDGTVDQIYAVTTPIGRIGMLSCGEHTAPEATFHHAVSN